MKVYADYNILGRLDDALQGRIGPSSDARWVPDHQALVSIWTNFLAGKIELVTCEDDCYMEFLDFARDRMTNYQDVAKILPAHMQRKFLLFERLQKGELLICPWGEYGFGRGPWGGGPAEHYELLDQIRVMLDRTGLDPHQDRDARHLLHCMLYRCDFFLTMDYKTIDKRYAARYSLVKPFFEQRGYALSVVTPSRLPQA